MSLLVNVAERLKAEGCNVAVASVPSIGLFLHQSENYQNQVLPEGGVRFGLTAGLPIVLYPLMRGAGHWEVFGLERFGASAPYKVLDQKFGYTVENIYGRVKELIRK